MYRIDRTEKGLFCETELYKEEWKRVDEVVGLWVSSLGRLHWNFTRRGARYSLTTNGSKNINNYYSVSISKKRFLVHRIVAHAFINPNLPLNNDGNNLEVDHIDTNPSNNRLSNLRVVTRSENMNNPLTREHFKEATPLRIRSGKNHWHYGKKDSEEHKRKLSEAHKGLCVSKETKIKLSNANIGNNRAFKGVIQAIKNNVVVAEFNNWNDIAVFVNADKGKVMNCIASAIKSGYKSFTYNWKRLIIK